MVGLRSLAEEIGVHARTDSAEAQEMGAEKRHQPPPERPLSFSRSDPSAHHKCLSFAFLGGNPTFLNLRGIAFPLMQRLGIVYLEAATAVPELHGGFPFVVTLSWGRETPH
jgi:hypothetical protein